MRIKKVLLLLLILFHSFLLGLNPAKACSGDFPPYDLEKHINQSHVILEGKILEVVEGPNISKYVFSDYRDFTALISVTRYFKGEGASHIMVSNFGSGPDCLSLVTPGEKLIVFADGSPAFFLNASYFTVQDATAKVTQNKIREILSAVNGYSQSPSYQIKPDAVHERIKFREGLINLYQKVGLIILAFVCPNSVC